MEGTRVTRRISHNQVGNTTIQQQDTQATNTVDRETYTIAKTYQWLWYIGHFIALLLGLRFLFLLLGAARTGIILLIYSLSEIFVLPFRGIFPSPRAGEVFVDTAALLAIAMYYLLILIITRAIALASSKTAVPDVEVK